MKYRLNIDTDGRVLSATHGRFGSCDMPEVDVLPDGDISRYRYVDGSFVHDPLPEKESESLPISLEERVSALEKAVDMLLKGHGDGGRK